MAGGQVINDCSEVKEGNQAEESNLTKGRREEMTITTCHNVHLHEDDASLHAYYV